MSPIWIRFILLMVAMATRAVYKFSIFTGAMLLSTLNPNTLP